MVVEVGHVLALVVPIPVANSEADDNGAHNAEGNGKAQRVATVQV